MQMVIRLQLYLASVSFLQIPLTHQLHEIVSSQESPYQGAARVGCLAGAGEPEAEHNNKADRGVTDKGHTAPKQGEQSRSSETNQLQPRVQITSQILGDEAGPRSNWEAESTSQGCDQVERQ